MQKGSLLRIILVILILGMGTFILIRNNTLKKELAAGNIKEITAQDFIPFGGSNGTNIVSKILDNVLPKKEESTSNESNKSKLVSNNVAGAIIINRADEVAGPTGKDKNGKDTFNSVTGIRYVAQENGYVYDYIPKYKKSYLISDTAIPKVSFAHFSPDGEQILFQYLSDDLETEKSVLGTLGASNVIILPDNIVSFAFGTKGSFAYFKKTTNGSTLVFRNSAGTENSIYSSPLTEWNVSFLGADLLITTKASELAPGFSYIVNSATKKVTKLWSNINGLTTKASSDGTNILQSTQSNAGPQLAIYNVKNRTTRPLNKMGLTEKCSFSPDGLNFICGLPKNFENKLYPDSWYSGEVSTDDTVARYTTENLNEKVLDNIKSENGDLDTWEINTNESGNINIFIDRDKMSLYVYEE